MHETHETSKIEEAVWEEKKKGISAVWIVPIVALLIGLWLFYQSWSEKGPEVVINFKSAAGIQAGKTPVKYKDVVVGKVTDVTFGEALKTVKVTAELKKNMKPFLSENTRFWVVQARLGVGEVQGLDTLLSGVYIVIDPHEGKEKVREYTGLDHIPVVTSGEKGRTFKLKADTIGSLSIGSPVYYKRLRAGSVASYKLDPDGKYVTIEVFVKSPFDKLINDKTRFYNASGIDVNMGANGFEIQTESLISVMMGGLAFDNFIAFGKGDPVQKEHVFRLYSNKTEAKKKEYNRALYFWVYFDESIRGLSVGAPVEFHGLEIGEVVNYSLVGNADTAEFKIPILIKIEPERFTILGKKSDEDQIDLSVFKKLLAKGFSAQLQTGNLITGELFIDLGFHPDVSKAVLKKEYNYYVIPSVPATMASLKSDLQTILKRIAAIPFEEIGKELNASLKDVHAETLPKLNQSLDALSKLIKDTSVLMNEARKNYIDTNAQMNKKIQRLLDEATRATRSVKNLTDYLERHPESLLKGK